MVSPPEDGAMTEARDADNNIIVSNYTQQSILPYQIEEMFAWDKVMCGC